MKQSGKFAGEAAVLIVDDHAPMREAIRACIERAFPGLSIVEAPDRTTALKGVEVHRPSLVLMDLNLPDANGLDLTREILNRWPTALVAAISVDASADLSARAQAAGAVEFISKDKLFHSLVPLVGAAVSLTKWASSFKPDPTTTRQQQNLYGNTA